MKTFLTSILLLLASIAASAKQSWQPDTAALGNAFQTLTISLPSDGGIPCTLIRPQSQASMALRRGVLYVHGFNDYFFQAEMADSFAARSLSFYAIDLQRYGRSLRGGQRMCDARHGFDEYFPALDSALSVMRGNGVEVITLMGHSTGGLICAYYMAKRPSPLVANLVLNSPFLAWNLGKLNRAIPFASAAGALFPAIRMHQSPSDAYAYSLLASHHGRWNYRTDWKRIHSPDVTLGWIRSVTRAQNYLKSHPGSIKVPTLLMTSEHGYDGSAWSPAADSADAVLSPPAIRRIGVTLAADGVTSIVVRGGLHDLFLSAPDVTRPLYRFLFCWIEQEDMLK